MTVEQVPEPKRRILMILSGPAMEIYAWQKLRLEAISRKYEGLALIPMLDPVTLTAGSIQVRSVRARREFRGLSNLKFYLYVLGFALMERLRGRKWDLITSFDPLKTGLLACWVAKITGARFCCEVNGIYHSPKNYLDVKSRFGSRIKMEIYPRLMRYVLARASGIKLLFGTQIDPFKPYLRNPAIHVFSDLVSVPEMKNIEERKEVLFVGFPFRLKGVDILIAAFKKVSGKYPDWKLKILGWFPDRTELDQAMAGHPRIYHHEPVYYRDMPDHMGRCGIFVLPSRSEGAGRVLQEAMEASKPRIGSDVGGIHTLINDGVDGMLFKPEDPDDLAAKLDILMGDADLRRKMGENGKRRMQTEFTPERYYEKLFAFYSDSLTR